jgi:hypothetical protein
LHNRESDFDSFEKLFQAMRDDPVIKNKMISILRMDSYPRHIVLSNWLEQLRLHHAPATLIQTLTCLFDDAIAESVSVLMKKRGI